MGAFTTSPPTRAKNHNAARDVEDTLKSPTTIQGNWNDGRKAPSFEKRAMLSSVMPTEVKP
jgi:hypothetical protein